LPIQGSTVDGGWLPLFVSPETTGWGRKCETGRCHGESATRFMPNSFVRTRWHVP
jgi:hypothetical protein